MRDIKVFVSPRFLTAALFILVLLLSACDMLDLRLPGQGPDVDPPPHAPAVSCSSSNNDLELAEATDIELALACLIISHDEQEHTEMHYHPTLGELARMRAEDMAENGFYGGDDDYPPHVDKDGYGPNHYLCLAEYNPRYCNDDPYTNYVESIGVGYRTFETMFEGWYSSPGHQRHVLGKKECCSDANYYGIGHAVKVFPEDKGWIPTNYWVFIGAYPPEPFDQEDMNDN